MTGMGERGAVEALLAGHELDHYGKNLGQWRTEYRCLCGEPLVSDGHHGITLADAHRAHLADLLDRHVREAEARAWDKGWCAGGSNVFLLSGEPALPQDNPYRAARVVRGGGES